MSATTAAESSGPVCEVLGCQAHVYCRGLCARHYSRQRRHGSPLTLKIGQEQGQAHCVECGEPIADDSKSPASTTCSASCRARRWRRRGGMAALHVQVASGRGAPLG
jgi:predicted nucleic acid-binding Zn ribbon protein